MNDDELRQHFVDCDAPPEPRAQQQAVAAAVAAALAAFDEVQADQKTTAGAQGSTADERLTPEPPPHGSKIMSLFSAQSSSQSAGPSSESSSGHSSKPSSKTASAPSPAKRWVYSGLASAAMLVLAVFITTQVPWQGGMGPLPSPAEEATGKATGKAAHNTATLDDHAAGQPALEEVASAESSRPFLRRAPATDAAGEAQISGMIAENEAPRPAAKRLAAQAQSGNIEQRRAAPAMAAAAAPIEGIVPPGYQDNGRDRFSPAQANPVKRVSEAPVSTFSIDVDTAAYSFVRRMLNQGVLPQKDAVRVEELINYFPYDYPQPEGRSAPFGTTVSVLDAPWKQGNKLVHIGIQGYALQGAQPRSNLVFLLDVSGSMNSPDKLPLVKQSMALLLSRLQSEDTVSIVVYAGAAGTVLEPTPVKDKQTILNALNRLQAGGSTAGAEGIQLAYQLAESQFIEGGVNRIVLATDGDFNVGLQSPEALKGFVERKRESGVYLSVLGFGQGNYHDALMQELAQNGNGVAAYIDTLGEAQKVLVHEATSTLFPIASDVKIQVEFNPDTVSEYRLIGYETRQLAEEDFNNDAVDAGDIGAGHSVTAIYEITPAGSDSGVFEPSRYGDRALAPASASTAGEYGFLKLRYKLPGEQRSQLISQAIAVNAPPADATQLQEARFATAVAGFGELLRGGKYTGSWHYADALALAQANRGDDPYGYRAELVQLIRKAEVAQAM
ncbi:vWA domain-containing protein [Parahaliea mediterranea]|uniref:vWA domain-containing protein n=1 Tax=Parahaliea mediterranea TaxID=651086 RepID=UPI001F4D3B63|nr:VWA domain-containing protein [Parahaliea mediterranea]